MTGSEDTETGTTADLDRIKRMIPHRYPFLLIDRVDNIIKGKSAVGIKNVTANEPHFQGHFPDKPIMPGVMIVEESNPPRVDQDLVFAIDDWRLDDDEQVDYRSFKSMHDWAHAGRLGRFPGCPRRVVDCIAH